MDQFHGLMDRWHSRSTMDRSNGAVVGLPELALGAAPVSGNSLRVGEKGEEL
jgi:hypothetical protein